MYHCVNWYVAISFHRKVFMSFTIKTVIHKPKQLRCSKKVGPLPYMMGSYLTGPTSQLGKLLQYHGRRGSRSHLDVYRDSFKNYDGEMHCHQDCYGHGVASEAKVIAKLIEIDHQIRPAKSFEELYDVLWPVLKKIDHVSRLTVYDVALRIAAYKRILPHDYVYLHCGAKKGFKLMFPEEKVVPFRIKASILPQQFNKLTAYELEDYFCFVHVNRPGGI